MSSSIPSLKLFVELHPDAKRILESGLSHSEALAAINALPESLAVGFQTSRTSVVRARQGLKVSELADPQAPGAERPKAVNWSAGVDVDRLAGTAEIRTRPAFVQPGHDQSLDDIRILREHGLDPDEWEVVSYRDSRWDQITRPTEEHPDGIHRELRAHKVSVRKRLETPGALDPAAVEQILSSYTARPKRARGSGTAILATPVGDVQLGKPENGGSAGIVERFARLTEEIRQRIVTEFGGRLKVLVVPILGDMIEGSTSQHGKLANDLGVTEQVRVVRRMLIHFLATLAPMADRVVCIVAHGNHGEQRRDRITTARDNWDVEVCSGVQDALAMDQRFSHVEWAYTGEDELSLAVEVEGLVIGATHGHTLSGADKMQRWLADQALGRQPVGMSDLIFSGHFHTFRSQDLGGCRTWFQIPSCDGGSAHFTNRKGTASMPGLVSVELLPGQAPHWSGLVLHTA